MEAIPTPKPTMILPMMITQGTGATPITIEPTKNTTSAISIDFLRPRASFIHPPIAAPMIAPATAILTMVSCSHVFLSTSSKSSRMYSSAPEMTPTLCEFPLFYDQVTFKYIVCWSVMILSTCVISKKEASNAGRERQAHNVRRLPCRPPAFCEFCLTRRVCSPFHHFLLPLDETRCDAENVLIQLVEDELRLQSY